ncbi:uncharacterized protein LOC107368367 isoform X2 [Tetranychus urticae]|uniref:F-box domain-containing protein n=1 Tax=Tetranychus urticae TaxID=32264 RepID=A0A158P5F7_TETUR|nr:uncharacterized protein LOC107368367 isoform X2 [Tetranychus urticae]
MIINELPDDCFFIIFGLMNELDDLLNCSKVCSKWSHLIAERTRNVKYLIGHSRLFEGGYRFWSKAQISSKSQIYPLDYVYYRTMDPIDGPFLSTLFPNLIIADLCKEFYAKVGARLYISNAYKSLKGIILPYHDSILKYCDKLEMLSIQYDHQYIVHMLLFGGLMREHDIKQLHHWDYTLDEFAKISVRFQNLQRLSISKYEGGKADGCYDGFELPRLKMLELNIDSYEVEFIYYGFQFILCCPNLQSAYISLYSNRFFVVDSCEHESLQDLVLSFNVDDVDCNELEKALIKYPNLKHLALDCRYLFNQNLKNEHVENLVCILPNLVLFVVRNCEGVTQEAADYIQEYNKLHGRSIKFYFDQNYHEIQSDWPQLSTKYERISHGFDFMKHCFLKESHQLPIFLVPNED